MDERPSSVGSAAAAAVEADAVENVSCYWRERRGRGRQEPAGDRRDSLCGGTAAWSERRQPDSDERDVIYGSCGWIGGNPDERRTRLESCARRQGQLARGGI